MFGLKVDSAVDLTGKNISHLKVKENRTFANAEASRIFMPDEGVFFSASLKIWSATTNRQLVQDQDYRVLNLDPTVTEISGKEVCGTIFITNPDIVGVNFDYQFVGGMFASGLGILKNLMEQYPNGIEAIVRWANILDKPNAFAPAHHMHHIRDFYGTDELLINLERVRAAISNTDRAKYETLFKLSQDTFDRINISLNGLETTLTTLINQTGKMLEVGEGEFIYTDNPNDPATYKNYGVWTRHAEVMLSGGAPGSAGQGVTLASGNDAQVRYTYLWQRTDGQLVQSFALTANKTSPINEGDVVKFSLATVNVPAGTTVRWIMLGADELDINSGATGQFTLDVNGSASVDITFLKDKRTEGTKSYRFQLRNYPSIGVDFDVLDTSKHVYTETYFSSDSLGINQITSTQEPSSIYLNCKTYNAAPNARIYFDWSEGTFTSEGAVSPLPTFVTVPSDGINRININVKADKLTTGTRHAIVSVKETGAANSDTYGRAACVIEDTSKRPILAIKFTYDAEGLNVIPATGINEGESFYIQAVGQYFANPEVLRLVHGGNVVPNKFSTIPNTLTLNNGLGVAKYTLKNDYVTTAGTQTYGVSVTTSDGDQFAVGNLKVNDTSKTIAVQTFFATNPSATYAQRLTAGINENTDFYYIIETPIIQEVPPINLEYMLGGSDVITNIRSYFSTNLPSSVVFGAPANNEAGLSFGTVNGKSRLTINLKTRDNKIVNGDQLFKITCETPIAPLGLTNEINIKDSSYPDFKIWWAKGATGTVVATEIDEVASAPNGNSAYLVVDTAGVPIGEELTINYTGAAAASFSTPFVTKIVATGGEVRTKVTALENYNTDGPRSLKASVLFRGVYRNEASLVIRDGSRNLVVTSVFMSNSSARVAVNQIGEGVTGAYFHFDFDEAPAGATLEWKLVNANFTSANLTPMSGTINVAKGATTAMVPFSTINDKLTGGNKTFSVQARINVVSAGKSSPWGASVVNTLLDTSKTVSFNIGFYKDVNGATAWTGQIDEGDTAYLVAKIANLPSGARLKFSLPSTGAGFADNNDISVGKITNTWLDVPANGIYSQLVVIDNSPTTEGLETLVVEGQLSSGETSNRASIVIRDTAKTFTVAASFVAADKVTAISSVNEGDIFYLKATYGNGVKDQKMKVVKSVGTTMVDATDYEINSLGVEQNITANDTSTSFWQFKATSDRATDGDKLLYVNLQNITTGQVYAGAGISIRDTSKAFVVGGVAWTASTSPSAPALASAQIGEGEPLVLRLKAANASEVTGDKIKIEILGLTLTQLGVDVDLKDRVFDNEGYVYWIFTLLKDYKTDGNQLLKVRLSNITTNTTIGDYEITILDTYKEPTQVATWRQTNVKTSAQISSVDEGVNAYLHLAITNDEPGQVYRASIVTGTGYIPASEMWSDDQWISDGSGNIAYRVQADINRRTDPGTRNIGIKIMCYYGQNGASKTVGTYTIPVNDTSKTVNHSGSGFRLSQNDTTNLSSVDEGTNFCFVLNVAGGEPTDKYEGIIVSGANLVSAPKLNYTSTQTYSPTNGKVVFNFTINGDNLTQGVRESLSVRFRCVTTGVDIGTFTIPINDTSKTPARSYALKWTTNSSGTTLLSPTNQVNEGGSIWLNVTGTNIPVGQKVSIQSNNNGLFDQATFVNKEFTLNSNGIVTIPVVTLIDTNLTGDRNATFTLHETLTGPSTASLPLKVMDTVVPQYDVWFSGDQAGNNRITNNTFAEGDTIYIQFRTNYVADQSILYVNYDGGSITAADWVQAPATQVRVARIGQTIECAGWLSCIVKLDQLSNEGASETLNVNVRSTPNGPNLANARATILDRTFDTYFATDAAGNNRITSGVSEGTRAYLIVKATNLANNATVDVNWGGSTASGEDFTNAMPNPVTVIMKTIPNTTSAIGSYLLDIKNDVIDG